MADRILTFNAGSSSLKVALFEVRRAGELVLLAKRKIEAGSEAPANVQFDSADSSFDNDQPEGAQIDHAGIVELIDWAETHSEASRLVAVGHRVVHGGHELGNSEPISEKTLAKLHGLISLAPLHQPHNLAPIQAILEARPDLPQVACFDTAFHRGRPRVTTRFALPREYENEGIERYGFHGLSYEYIAYTLKTLAPELASGRVIVAHLGNGASLCALRDGKSIDTTMSFTPLDGLPMGTRCGSIDPGVLLYLMREHGMGADALEDLLYHRSGLLGVSGVSSDMRVLLSSIEPRAFEAIELFVFRVAREIGALVASLNGIDGLVFTAGIGERAPEIRRQICARSAWLGVSLNEAANARSELCISDADSHVAVWVIPTDEEAMIARHTLATLNRIR